MKKINQFLLSFFIIFSFDVVSQEVAITEPVVVTDIEQLLELVKELLHHFVSD